VQIPGEAQKMTDIEDYWVRKEAEIGEPVEAKFYCKYLSGDLPVKNPMAGVLFFSSSTLYFQSFFSSKALESLLQLRRRENITESHSFKLPLKNLQCSFNESPQNVLSRLFAPPEQSIIVHLADGGLKSRSYRFSVYRNELETIVNLINK